MAIGVGALGPGLQDGTDRLMGIEDVIGTAFDDFLRGSSSKNVLYGGGGDDRLQGSGSGDRALGSAGSDVCEGVEQAESCGAGDSLSGPIIEVAVAGGNAQGA